MVGIEGRATGPEGRCRVVANLNSTNGTRAGCSRQHAPKPKERKTSAMTPSTRSAWLVVCGDGAASRRRWARHPKMDECPSSSCERTGSRKPRLINLPAAPAASPSERGDGGRVERHGERLVATEVTVHAHTAPALGARRVGERPREQEMTTRVVRIANRANREAPKSGDSRRIARRSIKSRIARIVI